MILDEIQQKIVTAKEPEILVLSGAGSGKTRVLTERIRYLIENGENPNKMVAITFTNNAAEEMKQRLGNIIKDMFIGTVHSYANKILLNSGINTSEVIASEKFDELFNLIQNNYSFLNLPEVDYLLVDEFQDTDENQMTFFFAFLRPKRFFFVGDDAQSIYSFRGANPHFFLNLIEDPSVMTYVMENNYRSGYEILTFANGFLSPKNGKKKIIPKVDYSGKVIQLKTPDLLYISNKILEDKNFKEWMILTRSNGQVEEVQNYLKKRRIPFASFKQGDLSLDEIKKIMEDNVVKVLTIHSAKGLESDNVAVIGARPTNDEERRVCYVAATRARKLLIWCYNFARKRNRTPARMIDTWE